MAIACATGAALAYANADVNISERAYLKEAISTGKTALFCPLISRDTAEWCYAIASPYLNKSGSNGGVVYVVAEQFILRQLNS